MLLVALKSVVKGRKLHKQIYQSQLNYFPRPNNRPDLKLLHLKMAAIGREVLSLSGLEDGQQVFLLVPMGIPSAGPVACSKFMLQITLSCMPGMLMNSHGETSLCFDVLVDDELRDSNYFCNENHFGRTRIRDGRNLNPMNDYAVCHSADYDTTIDVDQDMYRDQHDYNSPECIQGQHAREHPSASSERMLGAPLHFGGRQRPRADISDQIDESDLRHRLSNHRRVNGIRSVISQDHAQNNHTVDQNYHQPPQGDAHHLPPTASSVSNRFRGRIKLPRRSASPVNGSELDAERELESVSQMVTYFFTPGKAWRQDKRRVQEYNDIRGRSFRGQGMRDSINDNGNNFAGPKSLAELKGGKNAENEQQLKEQKSLSLGKQKYPNFESHRQSECDLLFEGPKPLNEILKRKRAAEISVPQE